MPKHKHADLMLLYAQDAAKTDKPWELWELRPPIGDGWIKLKDHPSWNNNAMYRRTPEKTDLEKYGVEKGDVWRLCDRNRRPGYTAHTVAVLIPAQSGYYRCTEGFVRSVTGNMTLLFRRGVVDKL